MVYIIVWYIRYVLAQQRLHRMSPHNIVSLHCGFISEYIIVQRMIHVTYVCVCIHIHAYIYIYTYVYYAVLRYDIYIYTICYVIVAVRV